jgi:hypothetical protein
MRKGTTLGKDSRAPLSDAELRRLLTASDAGVSIGDLASRFRRGKRQIAAIIHEHRKERELA